MTETKASYTAAKWLVTEGVDRSIIWDGDRPIGTVNKDVVQRMAAAQDMLEALEDLVGDLGGFGESDFDASLYCLYSTKCSPPSVHADDCPITYALAAIAKAKGIPEPSPQN